MLLQMRTFTRSWISYLLLFILAAMFVLFLGNGQSVLSALQFSGANYVARGNGFVVLPQQLTREMDLTLRAQRNQGRNVTQEDAIAAGIHRRLLESMIGRNAFYAYAERLGVGASNVQVANRIRQIPAVLNPVTGAFDEAAYGQFLSELRYSQADFERDVRSDITLNMLMEALAVGVRAPSSFGELAYTYNTETRVVSIAEAPASVVGAIAPATEAELQALYQELQQQLQVPEFRALTLVYARPQDFVSRVTVPEDRLNTELESRRASLAQPEKRTYVRITAQNQQQANELAARLGRGESADAVASSVGLQATRGENQSRTDVPDARVAEAVFSTQPRAVRVVQGELAPWVVVRVESVTPAVEADLTQARAELRQTIALDEAREQLDNAVSAFEDARGAGTAIADAARQAGLTVVTVPPVDAQGRGQDGQPVEAVAEMQDVMRAAFATQDGEASDFLPVGDGDVMVSVDRVIPASVRPFEEVRAQLAAVHVGRVRGQRLRELGEQVVADVRGGQSFQAAARAHRFNIVVASRPLDRQTAARIPARGLPAQIFASAEGAVLSDVRADGEAALVAVLEHINRPDPASAPQAVEASRQSIQEGLSQSLGEAIQAQVAADARPQRNERLLNQMFPSGAEQGQEGQ